MPGWGWYVDGVWVGAIGSARLNKHADGLTQCNASQSWNSVTMLTAVNADQYVCVVGWGFRLCSVVGTDCGRLRRVGHDDAER